MAFYGIYFTIAITCIYTTSLVWANVNNGTTAMDNNKQDEICRLSNPYCVCEETGNTIVVSMASSDKVHWLSRSTLIAGLIGYPVGLLIGAIILVVIHSCCGKNCVIKTINSQAITPVLPMTEHK